MRLLLLEKGRPQDPIHCSLKGMPIDGPDDSLPSYQALSYVWGKDDATHEIFLHDIELPLNSMPPTEFYRLAMVQAKPRHFYVRSNLYKALKRLRSEEIDLWFWIDAICINQTDNVEKSHQLPKMLDIYSNAWNVCIWIGEHDEDEVAIHPLDFIPDIVNLKKLDRMVSGEERDQKTLKSWVAFANLLKRSWFRRRWVIQEVAASRQASVQCANKSINWIDFADAIELFMTKLEQIRALYRKTDLGLSDLDALRHIESAGAGAIVNTTNNLLRKTEGGMVLDRLLNIESLVMTFLHFDATDPRDTIYALLSLASDGHMSARDKSGSQIQASLTPDYTKSPLQVYIDFVRHCITSSSSLDIICRNWALPLPRTKKRIVGQMHYVQPLPTWIRSIGHSPYGSRARLTGHLNGDSLVGEPGRRIYNASRGRVTQVRFSELATTGSSAPSTPWSGENDEDMKDNDLYFRNILDDNTRSTTPPSTTSTSYPTLFAEGIILSRITRISSRVVDGTISDDCLTMAGWNGADDINHLSDRTWRMLVADRAADGRHTPFWFRRACMYCLSKTTPDGDLGTSKLIADKTLPETVISYLKRVQAVVWSRKFFECQKVAEEGECLFGLGSRLVKEKDLVCILFGCSVPVVLREKMDDSRPYYELVGECYVHSKMDGEALAGMDEDSIAKATVEFNLR
jgi:hypothetical protein